MKKLSEMTLEELWELFPILLVGPNGQWTVWFKEEKASLEGLLIEFKIQIRHIGSTAVSGIMAKSIVDILIETETLADMRNIAGLLSENGYIIMSETKNAYLLIKAIRKAVLQKEYFICICGFWGITTSCIFAIISMNILR